MVSEWRRWPGKESARPQEERFKLTFSQTVCLPSVSPSGSSFPQSWPIDETATEEARVSILAPRFHSHAQYSHDGPREASIFLLDSTRSNACRVLASLRSRNIGGTGSAYGEVPSSPTTRSKPV